MTSIARFNRPIHFASAVMTLIIALVFALGLITSLSFAGDSPSTQPSPASPSASLEKALEKAISITDEIPLSPRTKNALTGEFEFEDSALVTGRGEMRPPEGVIPKSVQVTHIKTPKQSASVRFQLDRPTARALLGAAANSASAQDSLLLKDNLGNLYAPIGYCWTKDKNTNLGVSIDPQKPIKTVGEFPAAQMRSGDELFIYFHVNHGIKIVELQVGTRHSYPLNLTIGKN